MTETAAEELRGQIVCTIKRGKLPKSNISKGVRIAIQTLKKDNSIIILPADKGRAAVIINTTEYREKITDMVGDTNTYTRLSKDATNKYKNRMVNILRKWKRNGSISDNLYWKLYPESEEPQKLYGTPKIHKNNTPLRPIVSSCGSITYNAAKYLASILSPPPPWVRKVAIMGLVQLSNLISSYNGNKKYL